MIKKHVLNPLTLSLLFFSISSILHAAPNQVPVTTIPIDKQQQVIPNINSAPATNALDTTSLSIADRPSEAVLDWAEEKIKAAYTCNWVDYKEVMDHANSYFTKQGYEHYLKSLKDSGITESVINKKLILQLKKDGPPKLLKEGVYQGQYAWQVELPIIFMYYSVTGTVNVKAKIALLVSRASSFDFKDGLAITQLVLKPSE